MNFYGHNIDESLAWKTIRKLIKIHAICSKHRVKGGDWGRKPIEKIVKELRRAMSGTFPDRIERSKDVLNWHKPD